MTGPTSTAAFHVSVDGAVQGPLDEGTAWAVAAQHLATGRQVLVWRPGWTAWVHPSQVWARGTDDRGGASRPGWRPPLRLKLQAAAIVASVLLLILWSAAKDSPSLGEDASKKTTSSSASRTPSRCEQFAACVCAIPDSAERYLERRQRRSTLTGFARTELDGMCAVARSAARVESRVAGDLTCAGAFDHLADERNGTIIAEMLEERLLRGLPRECDVTVRDIDVEDDLAAAAEAKVLDRDPAQLSEASLTWSPMDPLERLALLLDVEAKPEDVFPELRKEIRAAQDEFARRDVQETRVPAYVEARQEILRVLSETAYSVDLQGPSSVRELAYDFEAEAYWLWVEGLPPVSLPLRSPRMRANGHLLAWPVKPEPARALKAELKKVELQRVHVAFTVVPALGSVRPLGYRFCTGTSSNTRACSEWVAWLPGTNPNCPAGGCLAPG